MERKTVAKGPCRRQRGAAAGNEVRSHGTGDVCAWHGSAFVLTAPARARRIPGARQAVLDVPCVIDPRSRRSGRAVAERGLPGTHHARMGASLLWTGVGCGSLA